MRNLCILTKIILFQQNTKIVKSNFLCLSKQYYQDTVQFFSEYCYKTEMLNLLCKEKIKTEKSLFKIVLFTFKKSHLRYYIN